MIKVLFFASNPERTSYLKLDEEIRAITEKIRLSDYRDVVELVSLWAVQPDDLLQGLNVHKPQIVHFSGHGSVDGEIILMDKNRQVKPVNAAALKSLFATLKDNIRLVILNACYSQLQAAAISENIDCVIGMSSAIGDEAAIVFAASFYRAIGFGRSIAEAYEQGKTAILLEGIAEEDTPKLISRPDVNPSAIFLVGESQNILPKDYYEVIPQKLKDLLNAGCKFIDIPVDDEDYESHPKTIKDYVVCELKMRQTNHSFVFRAFLKTNTGVAAEHLASELFNQLRGESYEWSLTYDDRRIPLYHTFETSGIKSGDTVYLEGNHKRPIILPSIGSEIGNGRWWL